MMIIVNRHAPRLSVDATLSELRTSVADLELVFAEHRARHGHRQAVFDLAADLMGKTQAWTTVHLAIAVAALTSEPEGCLSFPTANTSLTQSAQDRGRQPAPSPPREEAARGGGN
ncbi:hypothetical protein [Amycolatopsis sp. H20-H5]|uniref:hypothetical protein n=1 Tax=Amycolatopsis sp. H20-H5 TaxID=3046309 RepID=UPI002DBBDBFF|nr:hypothetical protein [Amycolatopsis sp. H20-H5]MEC3974519.1 hypothetical protein [Amycolatopsis sp. H20-H5]